MCNHQNEDKVGYRKEYMLKNDQQLLVRTACVEDAAELIEYMKRTDSESKFLAREPGEFNFTLEQEKAFIEGALMNENIHFLLGEVDGRIVANCSVGIANNNQRYRHRASLGISVGKDHWRKGIGKALMEECIYWCQEKGLEQLELEVVTQNTRAVSMYEDFGFKVHGTRKHALKYSDGSYADEYFMILFF